MKIKYSTDNVMIKSCEYLFCCKKMQSLQDDLSVSLCNGRELIGMYFLKSDGNTESLVPDFKIDYCPFCGEKIEINK